MAPNSDAGTAVPPASPRYDIRIQPRTDLSSSQPDFPSYFNHLCTSFPLPDPLPARLFRTGQGDTASV